MKCENIENRIEAYQAGELDFFQRKSVEKHIKKCPACRKKYAAIAAVSMLMFASEKSYKENMLKALLGTAVVKLLLTLMAVTVVGVGSFYAEKSYEKYVKANIVKAKAMQEQQSELVQNNATQLNTSAGSGTVPKTTDGRFRIISTSENKEVELILNPRTGKMEERKEK